MKKTFLTTALASAMVFSVNAEARDFGKIYTECGLGGLIGSNIEEESTANVMALITNITWDLGTTAISSDMTTPESCARGDAMAAAFILKSYAQLEKDLAVGKGEYLNALAEVIEVAPEQKNEFSQRLRDAFAKQATSVDYDAMSKEQKAEMLYNIVQSIS